MSSSARASSSTPTTASFGSLPSTPQSAHSIASSSSGEVPMEPLHAAPGTGRREAVVVLPEMPLHQVGPDPIIPGQSLPSPFPSSIHSPALSSRPPLSSRSSSLSNVLSPIAPHNTPTAGASGLSETRGVDEDLVRGMEAKMGALGMGSGVGEEKGAGAPGLGHKALLAKRFAKANKPSLVSPTDSLQSPCSAKLVDAKKKRFTSSKPTSLAAKLNAAQAQIAESGSKKTGKADSARGMRMMEL